MTRGFICFEKDVLKMKCLVGRLRRLGISAQDIVVVDDCRRVFRSMGQDDVLVVHSLCELADCPRELAEGLYRVRREGGLVDSVAETWFDMRLPESRWGDLDALFTAH